MPDNAEHRRNADSWHLDKRVPISLIVTIFLQSTLFVWWAATLTSNVDTLQSRPILTERVIRLETISDEHTRILSKLNTTLDKLDATMDRISAEQIRRESVMNAFNEHLRENK